MIGKVGSKIRIGGFTLVELMIVVAVMSLLAALAIPKMSDLIIRGKESGSRRALSYMRSAISIYYSDNEGKFPTNLETALTTNGGYMNRVLRAELPRNKNFGGHGSNEGVSQVASQFAGDSVDDDAGNNVWIYSSTGGDIRINCSHWDARNFIWSTW